MDYKKVFEDSIEEIFKEFEKMGQQIKNSNVIDRYLIAAIYKVVRLSKSIILLCENGRSDEALIILRSLIEHTVNMRWVMTKDTKNRVKMYLSDLSKKEFGKEWTPLKLPDRMSQIGFLDRDYFDFCVKLTYSYAHVNASSLRWGEVYNDPRLNEDAWEPEGIYQVAIQMTGHIMCALNTRYINYFKNYKELWEKIPVDKDIRKKVDLLKEEGVSELN